jgi:WD40-like Beta Propeller Repeat
MKTSSRPGCLVLALALFACRDDSTGAPTQPVLPGLLASRHAAEDPPQFSAWSTPVNLGPPVNTAFVDQGASISRDGLSLYFQCRDCPGNVAGSLVGSSDIYVSQRASVEAPWGPPQRLGPNINTTSDEAAPRLSRDGHLLFFNSTRPDGFGGADLYASRRRDKHDDFAWEPAVNLGAGVNTTAQEQQADPFEGDATGTSMLFYSVGPGGGTDLYVSTRLPDGTYGPGAAVAELNTASLERTTAIRRDGLEIFFASDRDGPSGNLDLFVATRASPSDPWSTPVNLGPTVNTSLIDARPALSFDGTTLYFQSTRPGAVGCTSSTGPCVFDIWVTTRTRLNAPDDDRGRHGRRQHDRHEH